MFDRLIFWSVPGKFWIRYYSYKQFNNHTRFSFATARKVLAEAKGNRTSHAKFSKLEKEMDEGKASRIRIRKSKVQFRGSWSIPKCHGSWTLSLPVWFPSAARDGLVNYNHCCPDKGFSPCCTGLCTISHLSRQYVPYLVCSTHLPMFQIWDVYRIRILQSQIGIRLLWIDKDVFLTPKICY